MQNVSLLSCEQIKYRSVTAWEESQDSSLFAGVEEIEDTMKEIVVVIKHVISNVEARKKSTEVDEEEKKEEERRKRILLAGICFLQNFLTFVIFSNTISVF
jgi:hypothetical protein